MARARMGLAACLVMALWPIWPARAELVYVAGFEYSFTGAFDSPRLWVINPAVGLVQSVLMPAAVPVSLAIVENGTRAYLSTDHGTAVVDTVSNTVTTTIPTAASGALALTRDERRLYVPQYVEAGFPPYQIAVVDTTTNTLAGPLSTLLDSLSGRSASWIVVSPDGRRVFTAVHETFATEDDIVAIDTVTNEIVTVVRVPSPAGGLGISPNGRLLYVGRRAGSSPGPSTILVIDTVTSQTVATIPTRGTFMLVARDGFRIYVSRADASGIEVIDTTTRTVVATVDVSPGPSPYNGIVAMAESSDGARLYAAEVFVNPVDIGLPSRADLLTIDLKTRSVISRLSFNAGNITGIASRPTSTVSLAVSAETVGPGDSLTTGVSARHRLSDIPADLYVGIAGPDGQITFLSATGEALATARLSEPTRFRPALSIPPAGEVDQPTVVRVAIPVGAVPGTYRGFAALVRRGAFADNRIDPGDILAIDMKDVTVAGERQAADLSVTGGSSLTAPGHDLTYAIIVANAGPATATRVTVTSELPANTTSLGYVPPSGSPFTCTVPPAGEGGTVTCVAPSLGPGQQSYAFVSARVNNSVAPGAALSATARVTANQPDPDPSNNRVTVDAFVSRTFVLTIIPQGDSARLRHVGSAPLGIGCGNVDVCSASFPSGTVVALTVFPGPGIFQGFSGDLDCADGIVTMDADKTCIATFAP